MKNRTTCAATPRPAPGRIPGPPTHNDLASLFRNLRQKLRLSPDEAAAMIGVSRRAYREWETGESLRRTARVLAALSAMGAELEMRGGAVRVRVSRRRPR